MDPSRLSKIAVGSCDPTSEERAQLAQYFGTTPARLFEDVNHTRLIGGDNA